MKWWKRLMQQYSLRQARNANSQVWLKPSWYRLDVRFAHWLQLLRAGIKPRNLVHGQVQNLKLHITYKTGERRFSRIDWPFEHVPRIGDEISWPNPSTSVVTRVFWASTGNVIVHASEKYECNGELGGGIDYKSSEHIA